MTETKKIPETYLRFRRNYPEVAANYEALGKSVNELGALDSKTAQEIMGPFGFVTEGEHSGLEGYMVEEGLMAGHGKVAAAGADVAKGIVARRLLGLPNPRGKPELPSR